MAHFRCQYPHFAMKRWRCACRLKWKTEKTSAGIGMITKREFYIDGKWVAPAVARDLEVIDPATEEA
ncbi:MAG: hypothetical protein KDJ51_05270, partial [Nitratireductor sp.]|nr:hypothetical protein [Nitratireductor sp.]